MVGTIRKLSLVYESGLSFTSATSAGVGGGIGGVGIGVARSKGTQVTAVAMKAAPPLKQSFTGPAIFAFVCLLFVAAYPVAWLGVALGAALVVTSVQYNSKQWPALYAQWDALYMCERCGFIGEPAVASERLCGKERQRQQHLINRISRYWDVNAPTE